MVAPVEFPVPAPEGSSFTNGELAIGPSASAVAGLTIYYLARWLRLRSGIYTIKAYVDDAAVWQLNGGFTYLTSTTKADGVVEYTVFVPEDTERFDITLNNMSTTPSLCYLAFSLWTGGALVYASSAEDWVIKSTPITDADLGPAPDVRLGLPVWSVLPNWQNGITERLEWLTDVLVSETSVEQRRSLRPQPRRSLECGFMRAGAHRERIDSFCAGIGQDRFTLPVFFEQARVTSNIPFGSSTVNIANPDLREFEADDVCMLTEGDPDRYELVQIDSINLGTGAITLKAPTAFAWSKGARIIPTRVVRLMDAPQYSARTDDVAVATIRFTFDSPDQVMTPDWLNAKHVFPFAIDYAQNVDSTYNRQTVVLDNMVASPMVFDYGRRARIGLKTGATFFGRANLKLLRQFLGMVRGRAQRFWMPSFMHDIKPVAPLTGTTIEAAKTGFAESFVSPQEARTFIAVFFYDDTPTIYRRLTGVATGIDRDVYGIDSAWPTIDMAQVRRISFMVPSRFDQDGFELQHRSDEARAVAVNFITMSADHDGMPSL